MKSTKRGLYIHTGETDTPKEKSDSIFINIVAHDIEHRHGCETRNFLPVFVSVKNKEDFLSLQNDSIARDERGIFQKRGTRRRYFNTN